MGCSTLRGNPLRLLVAFGYLVVAAEGGAKIGGFDGVTTPAPIGVATSEADLQSSGAACRLADLFLHSPADADGNAQPIDTFQSLDQVNTFLGQMDYIMEGFDVEARAVPEDRCTLQMLQTTTMVDPGSSVTVQLWVKDTTLPKSDKNPALYNVRVSRLIGTETGLRVLKIDNGILLPTWDMELKKYTAYLDVTQDIIKVIFQRLDNGQVIGLDSSLEEPLDTERRLRQGTGFNSSLEEPLHTDRRLQAGGDPLGPPIGEVQNLPSTLTSTIDVGRQRSIAVVVQSADRSQVGRYTFKVQRPFCPEERRFFDGMGKTCTDICNEGSFGSVSTGRCSMCLSRHCSVCDQQNKGCTSCMEGFALQGITCVAGGVADSGGQLTSKGFDKTVAKVTKYTSQHVLLAVASSVAATGALCACIFIVFSGNMGNRCGVRRAGRDRGLIESDEEYSERYSERESFAYS